MPRFPTTRDEILVLGAKIAAGIADHPAEYPNPPFDPGPLTTLLLSSVDKISDMQECDAAAKAAQEAVVEVVEGVEDESKRLIQLAETTHGQEAAILQMIGWDVRAAAKDLAPGQVRALEVMDQGAGSVFLDWKSPQRTASVGTVRYYRVERQIRDLATNEVTEEWGVWQVTATKTEVLVPNQPRRVEIAYRVIAVNAHGEGLPSNSQTVVL